MQLLVPQQRRLLIYNGLQVQIAFGNLPRQAYARLASCLDLAGEVSDRRKVIQSPVMANLESPAIASTRHGHAIVFYAIRSGRDNSFDSHAPFALIFIGASALQIFPPHSHQAHSTPFLRFTEYISLQWAHPQKSKIVVSV